MGRVPGRAGRRPGSSGTREAILDAARVTFAERGFAGTTVRAVAAGASVDPALVHHFYGTKDELFAAALALPGDLVARLPHLLDGDRAGVGERMTRTYLSLWEHPATSAPLRAVVRSAVTHESAAALLRELITSRLLVHAAARLGVDAPELRLALAGAHLVGVAMTRHVVRIEPLASADLDVLVAAIAPAVQRYLTGDLTAGPTKP